MTSLQPGTRDTRTDVLSLVGLVSLGVAFLFEMVAMDAVPVARDIQLFFIPHKHVLWESFRQLEIPLWTPLVRTGYPVLANFQSGVFYPPHWLYAGLPFFTGFNLLVVLHLVLGGTGMYVLCRRLDFGPGPAWVAAVSYMLGGYFVSLTNLINALQPAAWAPAMVAVLLHHVRSWRPASLAALVGVYLMGFLAGEPQTFLVASAMALGFVLVWTAGRPRVGDGWKRAVGSMGLAAAAVAGLAAVQILPTVEMVSQAGRGAGLTLEQSGRYSLAPLRTIHMVLANDFSDPVYRFGRKLQVTDQEPWLFSVYLGVTALVLAWHARWDRARRAQALFWGVTAVTGVLLALGTNTPLFGWLHAHVPGFSAFRYPEKFFVLTGFAVPMLAAHGTAGLLDRRPDVDRADATAALVALALGLAALAAWVLLPDRIHGLLRTWSPAAPMLDDFPLAYVQWWENLEVAVALLVTTVCLIGIHRKGHVGGSVFLGLLVVVVPLDFWLAGRGMIPVVDRSFYTRRPAVLEALPREDVRRTYRYRATPYEEHLGTFYTFPDLPVEAAKWLWQQTMQPGVGVLWDVQAHDAEDAIHLDPVRATDELLKELPPAGRHRILRLGSVRYLYHPLAGVDLPSSSVTRVDSVPGFVYELSDVAPRAYLAHGRTVAGPTEALNAILAPDAPYLREAVVLPAEPGRSGTSRGRDGTKPGHGTDGSAGTGALLDSVADRPAARGGALDTSDRARALPDPGSARIVADEGEEITIRVAPDTTAQLVLTDTWYPGWHAYVDGEERPLRRANYFFKSVEVRPGDETVVFRYRSEPLRRGALISAVSLVVLLAGLGGWHYRRRRARSAGGSAATGREP